jgi:hypothetical protein
VSPVLGRKKYESHCNLEESSVEMIHDRAGAWAVENDGVTQKGVFRSSAGFEMAPGSGRVLAAVLHRDVTAKT